MYTKIKITLGGTGMIDKMVWKCLHVQFKFIIGMHKICNIFLINSSPQNYVAKYKETRNGLIGSDYSTKFSTWWVFYALKFKDKFYSESRNFVWSSCQTNDLYNDRSRALDAVFCISPTWGEKINVHLKCVVFLYFVIKKKFKKVISEILHNSCLKK